MHNLRKYINLSQRRKKYNKMYMLISTERIHQNRLFLGKETKRMLLGIYMASTN